ncbi:hypothetical protein [Rhodococcus sp. SMB37]|uniref:hypothetical protein n=1 Tax=Rhodococcus sp. SMB37 TaxID=2512213 RepID=UPI001051980A|nr:hypothetical protein [Rhodococcus sp. SMB37]
MTTQTCPRCRQHIAMRHDGTEQITDERTSPWVFVEHNFQDRRGDTYITTQCPATGRNVFTARESW